MTKVVLVTGGNRGIGLEVCRQLAHQPYTIIMGSRDLAKGQQAAHQLGQANVHPYTLDVASEESRQQLYQAVVRDFGRLDMLINNAGIFPDRTHQILGVDLDLMRHVMEVNAYAPLRLAQLFVPLMKKQGWGRIINVSSSIGDLDSIGSSYPTYRQSKITLNLYTRILAEELKSAGITVNALCPGWVRTEMGGAGAPRSVEEGADTIVWLATQPDQSLTGGYFKDRQPQPW